MPVVMNEFPVTKASKHFDVLRLNVAKKSVPIGCSQLLTDLIWHLGMPDSRTFFLSTFKDGFGERRRISCRFKIF